MKRLYDKALIDQIAKVYGNEVTFLSEFSKALLDIIREGLIRDGQVRLHQFGTFKLKWMKSRNGVNPSTGEKIIIQARPRVIFTPAKALKERVEPNPPVLQPLDQSENKLKPDPIANTKKQKSTQLKAEESVQLKPVVVKAPLNSAAETEDVAVEPVTHVNEVVEQQADVQSERAVESIQDEIEILEQVVEVLKSDASEAPEIIDVTAEIPEKEVAESEAKTKWLDQSVVNNIKEISEQQYFSKAVTSVKEQPIKEQISIKSDKETVDEKSDEESHSSLDINLDSLAEKTETFSEKRKDKQSSKPILAIAASVIILLAAGIVINAINVDQQEVVINDQESLLSLQSQHVFSFENLEPEVIEENEYVASAVHVPVEIVNDEHELNALAHRQADVTIENEAADLALDQPVIIKADDEVAIENDSNSIVVSSEKYDELQRASLEQSVFFAERDHRLLNGDSLWRLAKKHYINPFHWPHIYQANHNIISNPDKVKIGKVVKLPTLYGHPDALTQQDRHNIATGYYYNYLYHKGKGNPFAYFSLIGVEKYDASLLIEYKEEIERSDINNLALLTE